MSATLMDTNPLPATIPEPSEPPATNPTAMDLPAPTFLTPAHRENPLLEIFVGPDGFYPATRWLIYLALGGMVLGVLGLVMHYVQKPHALRWQLISQAGVALAVILPAFAMARVENRPFGDFGLPAKNAFRRNFWIGSLWGIASLSVLMIAMRIAGVFEFGALSIHGWAIAKYAIYYLIFFLLVGFFEDFLFRGYSQWVFSQGMNFWPAAALLSAAFGAVHGSNPGESKVGLIAAGLIGFFFCLTLRRTGDLWWAIGFHMSWDWGESYFYSVPDSGGMMTGHLLNSSFHGPPWLTGGSVGPEASALIFVLLAALWVVFDRVYPEVTYET